MRLPISPYTFDISPAPRIYYLVVYVSADINRVCAISIVKGERDLTVVGGRVELKRGAGPCVRSVDIMKRSAYSPGTGSYPIQEYRLFYLGEDPTGRVN